MLLWDEDDICPVVFYSVISNSVMPTHETTLLNCQKSELIRSWIGPFLRLWLRMKVKKKQLFKSWRAGAGITSKVVGSATEFDQSKKWLISPEDSVSDPGPHYWKSPGSGSREYCKKSTSKTDAWSEGWAGRAKGWIFVLFVFKLTLSYWNFLQNWCLIFGNMFPILSLFYFLPSG